ncbi:toxin-antitoxin system YwqK family antitoxin [Fusobacterium sp.]|uniref:toxin-antitoxin system YwqK family antitoxin n=1 Tax=Fusobacterium sp. TaxID=68766 RepID=UPI00396C3454
MKKIIFLLLLVSLFISCGEKEVDISKKQVRNGIIYVINGDQPFSGKFIGKYDNGQIKISEQYKNGEPDGTQISYYSNGQINEKLDYQDGKPVGEFVKYYENGSIAYTGKYENGLKQGDWVLYGENKQPLVTKVYKDGQLINITQHVVDVEGIKAKFESLFN